MTTSERHTIKRELPFESREFDGLICTLATHHFNDLARSFREMNRVVKDHGRIVIFSADPRVCLETCWISHYFRDIVLESCNTQPELAQFQQLFERHTARKTQLHPFPLPHDLKDRFFFSGWRNPEAYLDETYRAGISSLATAPAALVNENIEKLQEDLASRKFHEAYGEIFELNEFDCGYFFLVA